jgi:HEAT repeat protein
MHLTRKLFSPAAILAVIGVMLCVSCQRLRTKYPPSPTLGPNSVIQEAIQALESEDEAKRQAAFEKLADSGSEAVPALMQALDDDDEFVRMTAALSLGLIGQRSEETIPALVHALGDEEREVREAAAMGLSLFGQETVPPLVQALEDADWRVRESAAETLGWIGPDAWNAIPALIQTLEDESQDVSAAVVLALPAITGQDFGGDATAWRAWWERQ